MLALSTLIFKPVDWHAALCNRVPMDGFRWALSLRLVFLSHALRPEWAGP
jgi:hypothetical protein